MALRILSVVMVIAFFALLAACSGHDSAIVGSNDPSGTFRTPPAVSASGGESTTGSQGAAAGSETGSPQGGANQPKPGQAGTPAPVNAQPGR